MDFSDVSLVALRVFREVAERGTFTAAATSLGYTQSAVSRQIASIERAAGASLLERRRDGVRLTTAGQLVLRNAVRVLDQIDATTRELAGLPAEGAARLVPQRRRGSVAEGNRRAAPVAACDPGDRPGGIHPVAGPRVASRDRGPGAPRLGATLPAAGCGIARTGTGDSGREIVDAGGADRSSAGRW